MPLLCHIINPFLYLGVVGLGYSYFSWIGVDNNYEGLLISSSRLIPFLKSCLSQYHHEFTLQSYVHKLLRCLLQIVFSSFPNLFHTRWMDTLDFWNTENMFQCLPIFAMAFGCQT